MQRCRRACVCVCVCLSTEYTNTDVCSICMRNIKRWVILHFHSNLTCFGFSNVTHPCPVCARVRTRTLAHLSSPGPVSFHSTQTRGCESTSYLLAAGASVLSCYFHASAQQPISFWDAAAALVGRAGEAFGTGRP